MHLTEGRESSTICCGASGAVSVNDLWRRLRRCIDDSAHCESVGLSVGTCRWTFHRSWISYALVQATVAVGTVIILYIIELCTKCSVATGDMGLSSHLPISAHVAPCWCTRNCFLSLMHPIGPGLPISARVCQQLDVLCASHALVQATQ